MSSSPRRGTIQPRDDGNPVLTRRKRLLAELQSDGTAGPLECGRSAEEILIDLRCQGHLDWPIGLTVDLGTLPQASGISPSQAAVRSIQSDRVG